MTTTTITNATDEAIYLRLVPGEPGVLVAVDEEIDVDDEAAEQLVAGGTFTAKKTRKTKKSESSTTDTSDQEGQA